MKLSALASAGASTLLAAGLLVTPAAAAQHTAAPQTRATAAAVTKLHHADAASRFRAAGIGWRSSGNCSDRNRSTCTSFEQLNLDSALGAITLKKASDCALTITGGTETGHASGTYSHWNGYKLDFDPTSCLSNYITHTFTRIANRGDGAAQWKAASGNIYARESNHWDVTFYTCGGC